VVLIVSFFFSFFIMLFNCGGSSPLLVSRQLKWSGDEATRSAICRLDSVVILLL